jgi:hypothetical protein
MGKTVFQDGNLLLKLPGTRVLASWLNKVFAHRHDGRDEDGSAPLDFAVDTGAVNALVVAMPLPFEEQTVGFPFQVKVAAVNTGPVTLALDTFAAAPVKKLGGLDLAAGDLQAGQIVQLAWDGAAYQLLSYNSQPLSDAQTLQGQTAAALAPPGAVVPFAMPTIPAGWLACDGRAVLRDQYSALYDAIGTTWGAGDNNTTFNLPDLRGEFLRGYDNGRGADAGRLFGSWQADALKSHVHQIDFTGHTSGGTDGSGSVGAGAGGLEGINSFDTAPTGGGETRPRNIALLVCIKY